MKYKEIVFMQGEEANEPLDLLDEDEDKCLEYLLQWDYGEGEEYEKEPWGAVDRLIKKGKYVINYNYHMEYIGLTEIIE